MRTNTPNRYSGRKRVRSFEESAYQEALRIAHNDGKHEVWVRRDCPACDYDGPRPEKKVTDDD